jgi:hypothetical protein
VTAAEGERETGEHRPTRQDARAAAQDALDVTRVTIIRIASFRDNNECGLSFLNRRHAGRREAAS